jgi:hypothetical protein
MTAQVYVPYTHLREATRLYLADQTVEPDGKEVHLIDVSHSSWGYTEHLAARWTIGQSWVNLEQDVVPWPGAIGALWRCREPWCFYSYLSHIDMVANGGAPFGLVRFSTGFMRQTADVWTQMRAYYEPDYAQVWRMNDIFLFDYCRQRGIVPHQHSPGVFNANPRIEASRVEDY